MRKLLLAISFLTILPAYGNRSADDRDMAGSLAYYPLVGFFIGGLLATLASFCHWLALGISGDALIIVAWIMLTGGLHLDGLMDSADGLFSGQDRDRKLEIMRDSRIGAMGAIALAALLLLKLSFLTALSYPEILWILILTPAFGRSMMVLGIVAFPYARSGPGLGKAFADQVGWLQVTIAIVTLLLGTFGLAGGQGLVLLGVAALPIALITAWSARQLGGLTGDSYGAICELAETFFLITAVVVRAII